MRHSSIKLFFLFFLCQVPVIAQTIKGVVFHDINQNLQKDQDEAGIGDVLVSNGREVVSTDANGQWSIQAKKGQIIFVIKPSEYQVPANTSMLPQHYHVVDGTEKSVAFPLWPGEKSMEFEALFFGDTQTRGIREVNFMTRDVVEECIGTEARFGVTLGDIVADEPWLFDEIAASIGTIGIPWYYVYGNHDREKGMKGNEGADKDFIQIFGPSSYAFQYGKVAFITLRNVDFKEAGGYRANFTDDQLKFVEQYMSYLPSDYLVVLMMHIPIMAAANREDMFRILEKRPYTLSLAGHTHELAHVFVDANYGWKGETPHHHFINGTVCGSWWCGIKDELGIPHATMNDGAPNGYASIKFTGNQYNIQYKAARRPADYQMNIYLPDDIAESALDTTNVLVNIFNGSEKSKVELQLNNMSDWLPMSQTTARDPANMAMHLLSPILDQEFDGRKIDTVLGWKMDHPSESNHFWTAAVPKDLKAGTYRMTVRTTDMFGNTYLGHRVFRINP
jgi:hypothetical protein